MLKRYSVILTILLSACGAWQAASDSTSNAYDTMFHNRGKTVNVDLNASAGLNQDSAGHSRPVAVRVYQLKERQRFDEASYADLVSKDTTVLASDVQASVAVVVNPGGAASVSQPMLKDTKYVAIAAFYQNFENAGSWKYVVPQKDMPTDTPLKLTLADRTVGIVTSARTRKR
jgi:type VI secretion system protein VasD